MLIITFIYNLLTTTALLLLVHANPRYMMQDYPPQITAHIPPQTRAEKKASLTDGFPFLFILAGFPLVLEFVERYGNNFEPGVSAVEVSVSVLGIRVDDEVTDPSS